MKYEKEGTKISERCVRTYCKRCGTPMRATVTDYDYGDHARYCEKCDPHIKNYQEFTPRQESVRRRQSDRTL